MKNKDPLRKFVNNRNKAPIHKGAIILTIVAAIAATVILAMVIYLNPYLFRRAPEEIIWVNQELTTTDYDIIVVGAEPEGIAAAIAAARNGMNTILLERSATPGGLLTLGKLNFLDMCHGRDGTLLTRGFFEEFYKAVDGSGYEITEAVNFFIKTIEDEPLLTFRTGSSLVAPVMEGNSIIGVRMLEQGTEVIYTAKRFIDATTDGDLCAMSGAPYTYGGEDIGEIERKMGVTLIFELSDVRWASVFFHLNMQRLWGMLTGNQQMIGSTNKIAWGYEDEGISYKSNDPMVRLRGLNIARQRRGSVLINALVVFDTDPLDPESYQQARNRAEAELTYLIPYFRENYKGFKNANLKSTAERLYVRESRRITGEYLLTIDDVLENRDQWDKIAIGSYPADVQPSSAQRSGTVIGNPDRYSVPFRSLVPLIVDNLLIVGRSASFSSLAASSARVVPLGMACGQAAGTAAVLSIKEGLGFRQMSRETSAIAMLQATLTSQGAYLEDFAIDEPIMSHWAYNEMAVLRRLGLMTGGYDNNYMLDSPIGWSHFRYLFDNVVIKAGYGFESVGATKKVDNAKVSDLVVTALLAVTENNYKPSLSSSGRNHIENLEILESAGLLDKDLSKLLANGNEEPDTAEVVVLVAGLYEWLLAVRQESS